METWNNYNIVYGRSLTFVKRPSHTIVIQYDHVSGKINAGMWLAPIKKPSD